MSQNISQACRTPPKSNARKMVDLGAANTSGMCLVSDRLRSCLSLHCFFGVGATKCLGQGASYWDSFHSCKLNAWDGASHSSICKSQSERVTLRLLLCFPPSPASGNEERGEISQPIHRSIARPICRIHISCTLESTAHRLLPFH